GEFDKSKGKKRKEKNVETPSDSDFDISEDGAISESEVTGTVASKFGGPRIAKEHAPDTTNYPTPRSHTRNLK
ncbi:hypothetical protein H5410_033339, partial [Solanum commersonii]